jgi:adenosyl cobinamide kinase/adenosyl cobinamide phosphate guanylyltransferase
MALDHAMTLNPATERLNGRKHLGRRPSAWQYLLFPTDLEKLISSNKELRNNLRRRQSAWQHLLFPTDLEKLISSNKALRKRLAKVE